MQTAEIKALRTFSTGMVVYSVLVGEPATGKSPALGAIRKALVQLEVFLKVDPQKSQLVNCNIKLISNSFFKYF